MIVSISTIESRIKLCAGAIKQMRAQSIKTTILLHCDGFKPPRELRKLADEFTWSPKPKGTTRRLKWALKFDDSTIMAVIDDDIAYPSNYLKRGANDLKKYGDVVAYHGRTFRSSGKLMIGGLHFKKTVKKPVVITAPGCGVMLTRAEILKAAYLRADRDKFMFRCDMLLAVTCWHNKWKMVRPPSEAGWLQPIDTGKSPTICSTRKKENKLAIKYAKSIGWPN